MVAENILFPLVLCSRKTAILTVPVSAGCLNQVQGFGKENLLRAW